MRKFLLTASTFAAIAAVPPTAAAQVYAADVYPAPGAVVVNPPAVVGAPTQGQVDGAPMVQSQVYLAPGQTYVAPGTAICGSAHHHRGPALLPRLLVGLGSAPLRAEAWF